MNQSEIVVTPKSVLMAILSCLCQTRYSRFLNDPDKLQDWFYQNQDAFPEATRVFSFDEKGKSQELADSVEDLLQHRLLLPTKDPYHICIDKDMEIEFILKYKIPLQNAGLDEDKLKELAESFIQKLC